MQSPSNWCVQVRDLEQTRSKPGGRGRTGENLLVIEEEAVGLAEFGAEGLDDGREADAAVARRP
jgi:hypothetical protein